MALLGQIEGGGEAGRPGADDGDALAGDIAGLALGGDLLDPFVIDGVHRIALEPANGDGLAAVAHRAGGLAAMGADAPAGVREGVGAIDLADGFFHVVLPDGADVLGRVHLRRAGVVTHAALHAARCLDDGLVLVVASDDLVEVVDARGGLRLGHVGALQRDQIALVGLGPALVVGDAVDAVAVRQHEVAVQVRIDAGMHVLARQRDGAGGAEVDAQGAPAAAAVVDGGPEVAHALGRVLRQAGDLDHGDGGVVADLLAGAAADTGLPVVEVEAAIVGGGRARVQRHGDRLAAEELEVLQRGEDAAAWPL